MAVLFLAPATPALARLDHVRVVASDDHGVTLRLDVPAFQVVAAGEAHSRIQAPGLPVTTDAGRPALPFATALIALPPGARAVLRGVEPSGANVREGVDLEANGRSILKGTVAGTDFVPIIEPVEMIRDGVWPAMMAELGEPYTMRRLQLVTVRVFPFAYEAVGGRISSRTSVTVRVDFVGGRPADGVRSTAGRWDQVLRGSVVNFERASGWRVGPGTMTSSSPARGTNGFPTATPQDFDEAHPEVRVLTDTTGIYALRFSDLADKGYPAGIPVDRVSVHRHEFLEGANPTYSTVELPVEVDDTNSNGVFDGGDRVVVFVMSWARRSRASWAQRQWGDGEVLYVTSLTDRPGFRVPSRPGWRDRILASLASYPATVRFEQDLSYTTIPPDTNHDAFFWSDVLYQPRPFEFPFELNDHDTTGAVTFTVAWTGTNAGAHFASAGLRNSTGRVTPVADAAYWFGYDDLIHRVTVPGGALGEGLTNTLVTTGYSNLGDLAYARLNWFEVSHYRRFRAIDGRLHCNSAGASGDCQIRASGFGSHDIRVYDVTDSLQPMRLEVDPSRIVFDGREHSVTFQDVVAGAEPRQYCVFDRPRIVPPERIAAVTRRGLVTAPRSDYLIVVPEAWIDAANALAEFRRAQGHVVLIAPVESINDEFNGGRRSAYALKRFFEHALDQWDTEFVVLLGDGSEDPQNRLGDSGIDHVPAQTISSPVDRSGVHEVIPSDTWLVSFQPGPDPVPIPELFIGRVPANSREDLQAVIAKIINYETVTAAQVWRRNILLLADDKYSTTTFFGGIGGNETQYCEKDEELVFEALSDSVRGIVSRGIGAMPGVVELMDLTRYLRGEPFYLGGRFGNDTCRVNWADTQRRSHETVTPQIFQRLNDGCLWWNFQGHSNQQVLCHEDLYVNRTAVDDKEQFTNVDRPFLFSAFSCHPNAFAGVRERAENRGPALGEDLVMLPDRGAIASWSSAGYELLPVPRHRPEHLNTRFARALFTDPPRDPRTGGARLVLGEVVAQALHENFITARGDERLMGWSYCLLGDPGTRITMGPPHVAVTANGVPVTSGEPMRLFSFGDTLRIDAAISGSIAIRDFVLEYRDDAVTRVIPRTEYAVTPVFPDTGAAASGGRHFSLAYRTTLRPGSYRYVVHATDANGLAVRFDVVFEFQTQLRADGEPLKAGDPVRSDAQLSLLILSPSPIQPDADLELELDGTSLAFTAAPFRGDSTGREWLLQWPQATYSTGSHRIDVRLNGLQVAGHGFEVTSAARFENLLAFPNPFDGRGTSFSFTYFGGEAFDLLLRVFTVSGRLIHEHIDRGLQPGYHQLQWNGCDAEGQSIANGIYFYTLTARSGSNEVAERGRLVRLRAREVANR